jgi:Protein of unknown function (DUF1091)
MKITKLLTVVLILVSVFDMSTQLVNSEPERGQFLFTYNLEYLRISMNQTSNRKGILDPIYFTVLKEIPNFQMDVLVEVKSSKFVLVNYTMNFCFFERYRRRNIFIRLWSDILVNSIDFKLGCPFKVGVYKLKERSSMNMTQTSKYIPSFIRFNDSITLKFTGYIKKPSRIIEIFTTQELWNFGFSDSDKKG